MMNTKRRRVCLPGEALYPSDSLHRAGDGTYVSHGQIYASLAGYLYVSEPSPSKESAELTSVVEVRTTGVDEKQRSRVPPIGSIVTARVTYIGQRFCKCLILCVEETILRHPFNGVLRKEDIRATDKDRVEIQRCYRPTDLILARVTSAGGESKTDFSFLLSTAEDELGVVSAHCDDRHKMIPISWTQMKCTVGGDLEQRKVAKVPHLLISGMKNNANSRS